MDIPPPPPRPPAPGTFVPTPEPIMEPVVSPPVEDPQHAIEQPGLRQPASHLWWLLFWVVCVLAVFPAALTALGLGFLIFSGGLSLYSILGLVPIVILAVLVWGTYKGLEKNSILAKIFLVFAGLYVSFTLVSFLQALLVSRTAY